MATPVAEMICAAALPAVKQLQNTAVSTAGEMGSICQRRTAQSIFGQGPAELLRRGLNQSCWERGPRKRNLTSWRHGVMAPVTGLFEWKDEDSLGTEARETRRAITLFVNDQLECMESCLGIDEEPIKSL